MSEDDVTKIKEGKYSVRFVGFIYMANGDIKIKFEIINGPCKGMHIIQNGFKANGQNRILS